MTRRYSRLTDITRKEEYLEKWAFTTQSTRKALVIKLLDTHIR